MIEYYTNSEGIEDKHLRKAFADWFKLASEQEKLAALSNPFHLDMYRIQMSKPPFGRRRLRDRVMAEPTAPTTARQKLSRLRSLQDRLRHIEQMKAALQQKIVELQKIREKERSAQIRIENEVSQAERDWKDDVDRFRAPGYQPLVRLGDESHLI